jgi:hypothetical protein
MSIIILYRFTSDFCYTDENQKDFPALSMLRAKEKEAFLRFARRKTSWILWEKMVARIVNQPS